MTEIGVPRRQLAQGLWLISPKGRLNAALSPLLEQTFSELLELGAVRLIVDLADTVYMASVGIKTLLVARRRARAAGGDLCLTHLNERVKEILALGGFEQVFTLYATLEAAVQAYSHPGFAPAER